MRIAIIGGGIAGLSAAWFLKRDGHETTLYEKSPAPGLINHTAEIPGADGSLERHDLPLRVFNDHYWSALTTLCVETGMSFDPIPMGATYCELDGSSIFRYDAASSSTLDYLRNVPNANGALLTIARDLYRFDRRARRARAEGLSPDITMEQFLREGDYSGLFRNGYLYPVLAVICTCGFEALRNYPAAVLLEVLRGLTPLRRMRGGVAVLARRILDEITELRLSTAVKKVRSDADGASVETADGSVERYDHVVLASQANHALEMLDESADFLRAFVYENIAVTVHRDERFMPARRGHWKLLNYLLPRSRDASMCTIWSNRIEPALRGGPNVFQTVNPLFEARPDSIIRHVVLQRPVVDTASLAAVRRIKQLHEEEGRRIWFSGAYSVPGVPLLESGVRASLAIARRLGVSVPAAFDGVAALPEY